jgi:cell division protein FtsI (penicillin-binding protein 3)
MKKAAKTTVAERARWRGALLLVGFALGAAALEGRILYLQLVDRDFLAEQADDRHIRTVQIPTHRGSLTDRYGEPLAVSTPVDSLYANPKELKQGLDRLGELAAALEQDDEWLARKITSNSEREFVWLERRVPPTKAQRVLSLGLPGVGTVREYRRYYPAGEVAAHVVGFTDVDDRGQEGLEAEFDHWLKGEPGSKRVMQNRRGEVFDDVELLQAARPGRDLRTSIDLRLQYLAYRELKAVIGDSGARWGSVVVLDPRTGEVLAMVNQPSQNPNADRSEYRPENYRNRAATDLFEPGSSFKPLVMATALESGAYGPRTPIDTSGAVMVGGRAITEDPENLGRVTLTTVLAKSSNVGAARVAMTMEPAAISDVLKRFGIGRLTDSAFPGESTGSLADPKRWCAVCQVTLSYGYGVQVTTLQLARAYAAIAADGVLRPVSLLALDEAPPGERVISADTAADLTTMLEAVVSKDGTGYRAAVRNFHIAGKTGTTRKAGVGGYDNDRHGAIFAGFAPATNPRLVVVVMIDEPQGAAYHGGDIAAPVFGNIVSGALRVLAVPPDALPAPALTVVAHAQVRP